LKQEDFGCNRCGRRKTVLYVRAPEVVYLSILLVVGFLVVRLYMESSLLNFFLTYIFLVAPVYLLIVPLRIRCLTCEPEWEKRVWWRLMN
jgi:hypothetical protein